LKAARRRETVPPRPGGKGPPGEGESKEGHLDVVFNIPGSREPHHPLGRELREVLRSGVDRRPAHARDRHDDAAGADLPAERCEIEAPLAVKGS
jgi:hypothetical protein